MPDKSPRGAAKSRAKKRQAKAASKADLMKKARKYYTTSTNIRKYVKAKKKKEAKLRASFPIRLYTERRHARKQGDSGG